MTRPNPPQILALDPGATRLLDLMVDLGHLDDRLLALVNDRLLDLEAPDGMAHFADVKRVVASVIFEHIGDVDPEYARTLDQEWGLLFY